jgi:hypothetical protein
VVALPGDPRFSRYAGRLKFEDDIFGQSGAEIVELNAGAATAQVKDDAFDRAIPGE